MAGETIREFLIGIGFSVDNTGFGKFDSAVLKATGHVVHLGAVAAATATAVEVMVERVARQFEDLYYSSQRTHATVDSLQAVGFAARQVGLQAGQGRDLLEGLGRAMRFNPGIEGVIRGFGIETRATNGQLKDMSVTLDDVIEHLAKMPRYQAMQYGGVLGLDPDTLNRVLDNLGKFKQAQSDARESLRDFGLDAQKVGEDSAEFGRHVNALEQSIGNLATRIAHDWMPYAEKVVDLTNASAIAFGRWNNEMGGTPGMLAGIITSLGGVATALGLLSKVPGFAWLAGIAGASAVATGAVALGAAGYVALHPSTTNAGEAEDLKKALDMLAADKQKGLLPGEHPSSSGGGAAAPPGKAAQMTDWFVQRGWTREQASGIVANLQQESSLNAGAWGDHGTAYGVAQWHQDRQDAFRKKYGRSIVGSSEEDQLNFVQYELTKGQDAGARRAGELLSHAQTAAEAARTFSKYYERPAGGEAEAAARAGVAVTLNQKTEINVNGGAADTAGRVVGEQERVNGDLVRNLGSVYR